MGISVVFANNRVRKLCNNHKAAVRKLGPDCAKRLTQRLGELAASDSLAVIGTLHGPRCEELSGARKGQLSVRLEGGMRLIFRPAHDPVPIKPDGGLDWKAVTAIEILEIKDYH